MKLFRLPFGGLVARLMQSRWVRLCVFWGGAISLFCGNLCAQPNPDTLWTRRFPYEECNSIVASPTGGYLIAGANYTSGFRLDARLVKTDEAGNLEWSRAYGDPNLSEILNDAIATRDGGYIAVGHRYGFPEIQHPQVYVLRVDADGDTLWTFSFECYRSSYGRTILQNEDGNFIAAGYTHCTADTEGYEPFVLCLNDQGELLWMEQIATGEMCSIRSSALAPDGGYYFIGNWGDWGESDSSRMFLIRTDVNGDSLWTRRYGGARFVNGQAIAVRADGQCFLAGFLHEESEGGRELYVVMVDSLGERLWASTQGGDSTETVQDVGLIDNGCVVFGTTSSYGHGRADFYAVRFAEQGDTLWTRTYGTEASEILASGLITSNHECVMLGIGGGCYVVKTGPDVLGVPDGGDHLMPDKVGLMCVPNPFNGMATITLNVSRPGLARISIYDLLGREVQNIFNGAYPPGSQDFIIQSDKLASGTYLVRAALPTANPVLKILLVR